MECRRDVIRYCGGSWEPAEDVGQDVVRIFSVTEKGRGIVDRIGRDGYSRRYSQACIVVHFRYVDAMQSYSGVFLAGAGMDTTLFTPTTPVQIRLAFI